MSQRILHRFSPSVSARLIAAFFLLVVVVFWDPLFTRRTFAGRDLLGYHLPIEKAVHDAYARGRFPVWISEISGGRPLLPNPNVGALYPLRWILSPVAFPAAMRIFPALHWSLAGAGMLLLLRSLDLSAASAWLGAVTYVFSGVGISQVFYTNLQPGVALIPWILWCFRRGLAGGYRWTIFLSLLIAVDMLAGDVVTVGLAILAILFWIGTELPAAERRPATQKIAGAVCLGALLALPQIVATWLWVPLTRRAVSGMKLEESLFFSLRPWRLVELFVPFPFGATWDTDSLLTWAPNVFGYRSSGFFMTLYAGALAPIGLIRTWRTRASGLRFAKAFFLGGLLLSVAPSLVPASWGSGRSPLPLRYPEKFAVAAVFALAIFAARGVEEVRRESTLNRWLLASGAVFALLAATASLFPSLVVRVAMSVIGAPRAWVSLAVSEVPASVAEAGLLWIGTTCGLAFLASRERSALALGVVLLTILPIAATRRIAPSYEEEILSPSPFARRIQKLDPEGAYRTLGETLFTGPPHMGPVRQIEVRMREWASNTQALWGRGTVLNGDFDAGDLSRLDALRRLAFIAAQNPDGAAFFSALALRWGIRYREQMPLAGYRRLGGDGMQDWDELAGADRDVRLLERWTEENDLRKIAPRILAQTSDEAVLETGDAKSGTARPGQVRVLERSPERLVVETDCPDPTWLFVVRGFWDSRTVLVDGRRAEVVPAQIALSALAVPGGKHRVEWQERIPGGQLSRWGPVLYSLIALLMVVRK
jgi:hypothetical protein